MKKLLMLILIGLLVILSIFIVIKGFEIGNVEVLSYNGIQTRNKELDEKIQQASKLAEKDYKQAVSNVQENSKKLQQEKKEYEHMIAISTEGDAQAAKQIERYEVETLWVKLGNHATSEGAVLRMDIVKGNNAAKDIYNLNFTVTGSYISITDFISDIENDSTLGFKIEEFKMLPTGTGNELKATFVCKDIAIKDVTETSNPNLGIEDTKDTTNTTNTNTTNTNNTTNGTTTNKNTTSNSTNVTQ